MLVTVDKAYELSLRGACSVSRDMKRLFVPRSNGNIVAVTEQLNLCHALFLVNGATSFVQTPASATPTGQLPSLLRFQQILNPARARVYKIHNQCADHPSYYFVNSLVLADAWMQTFGCFQPVLEKPDLSEVLKLD